MSNLKVSVFWIIYEIVGRIYVEHGLCHVTQPGTLYIQENINSIYGDLCESECS